MRLKQKLISFKIDESCLPTDEEKHREMERIIQGLRAVLGVSMASPLIKYRIGQGRIAEVLETVLPAAEADSLGIVFRGVEGGSYKYQGEAAEIESFELAETPFTIGQMKKLLESKGDEVRAIFQDSKWNIDKVIQESENKIADDVPAEERDNCPLVYVSQIESAGIARLLGYELPNERQWERAASGTDGLKRPWGNELSADKAVYDDSGTRPVKSKPGGVNATEGIYDLIGLVWEWTISWYDSDEDGKVLRGGSWCHNDADNLSADYRSFYHAGDLYSNVGLRFARTLK